jgi:hypothetical protein
MFILSPDNRDQPDDVLLDDLRLVASRHSRVKLTRELYAQSGRFSPATIAKRFGGWGRAIEKAGLVATRHHAVTQQDAVLDLQRVAAKVGANTVSVAQYGEHGKFSVGPYVKIFGSWVAALAAAGLQPNDHFNPRADEESLFENLEKVWQSLGRQPTVNDMFAPLSSYSADTYKRRFGGWRRALEAFVQASAAHPKQVTPLATPPSAGSIDQATQTPLPAGTSRSVGWRLRYLVLSRDRFACRACGRSPATHPGVVLQVDHIVPWSRGGQTIEANLQTLCEQCNGGKGAA